MSCAFDKEGLTAFFDGEMDAAERAETERHISGCSECLRELGEIKSAAFAVKSLSRPRAPRSIADGVSRQIAAAGRIRRIDVWRRRVLWSVAAAAGLLVALNVAYFADPPSSTRETAARPAPSLAPGVGLVQEAPSSTEEARKQPGLRLDDEAGKKAFQKSDAELGEARDKDGARRELQKSEEKVQTQQADRAAVPDEAPALKKPAPKPAAAAVPAAPPPAPPPAPEPAPVLRGDEAKARALSDALRRRTEGNAEAPGGARPAADPKSGTAGGGIPPLPEAPAYTVSGAAPQQIRARVEALSKSWSAAPEAAAKGVAAAPAPAENQNRSFGAAPAPLVLDLSPEQFEQLRAELARAGARIEVFVPPAASRGALKEADAERLATATDDKPQRQEAEKKLKQAPATRRVTLYFLDRPAK